MFRSLAAASNSRAVSTAAQSSSLGMVAFFKGATLVFAVRREIETDVSAYLARTYTTPL